MLAAVAFGVMLGVIYKRLACFAQLYMMCSNLIIFTSGLIFPYYLMPKWLSIASRIFSPIANIAVELKAVNLKGIGWDAAWPQLAGTALYTVFWLAAGAPYTLGALKGAEACRGGGVGDEARERVGDGVGDGVRDGEKGAAVKCVQ